MNSKCCLLLFGNKKINNLPVAELLVKSFSANGIYFDRVQFCAYDDPEEIARSISECKGVYSHLVLWCPSAMEEALKGYAEKLFSGTFDNFGVLSAVGVKVFIILSDAVCKLDAAEASKIISADCGKAVGRAYVKTVGAPPAAIGGAVSKAKEICADCDFNVSDSYSDVCIEIVYPLTLPKATFDEVVRVLVSRLNDYVYALEDTALERRLFELLKLRRMKISVAESFTGGGLAKRLVSVPGISEVYFEGLNTYSNESKMKRLNVGEMTLKQFGAVSENTASEMAEGLIATGDCDIAVSTTGIAGPDSDMTMKPVGLLYIGVSTRELTSVYKYELKGSRMSVTETAINLALFHVFKTLK